MYNSNNFHYSSAKLFSRPSYPTDSTLGTVPDEATQQLSSTTPPTSPDRTTVKSEFQFPYIPPAFSLIPDKYLVGMLYAYRSTAATACFSPECASNGSHICKIRLKGGRDCLPRLDPDCKPLNPDEMAELRGFKERAASLPTCDEYGNELKVCSICGTIESSTWRRHDVTTKSVCNSCGLYFKLHRRDRRVIFKPDGKFYVDRTLKPSRRSNAKKSRKNARQSAHPYQRPEPKEAAPDNKIADFADPKETVVPDMSSVPFFDQVQIQAIHAMSARQQLPSPVPTVDEPQQTLPLPLDTPPLPISAVDSMTIMAVLQKMIATGQLVFDYSLMQFVLQPLPFIPLIGSFSYSPLMAMPPPANSFLLTDMPSMTGTLVQQLPRSVDGITPGDTINPVILNISGPYL